MRISLFADEREIYKTNYIPMGNEKTMQCVFSRFSQFIIRHCSAEVLTQAHIVTQ